MSASTSKQGSVCHGPSTHQSGPGPSEYVGPCGDNPVRMACIRLWSLFVMSMPAEHEADH